MTPTDVGASDYAHNFQPKNKTTMKKYAFNHDAENLPETLGVPDERWDEIAKAAKQAAISGYMIDPEIKNSGQMIELAMNTALPQSAIEGFVLGWCLGCDSIRIGQMTSKLAKAMKESE